MTDCSVCCETLNNGGRCIVRCPYCEYTCCGICFRTYLMGSSKAGADCMSCHRELSLEFVSGVTPKNFHNDKYRRKRADDLLSLEKSLLPDTQHLVEARHRRIEAEKEVRDLEDEMRYLKERMREIRTEIYETRWRANGGGVEETKEGDGEKKKFIMGCPAEDCRGFLSQAWKCGTCNVYVCSKCRVIKNGRDDEDHVCKKEDIETCKLLANDTKPCPNCTVPIFKISGCDQMYCTSCNTAFSWKTGKIETGVIHNPHFYQYQRQQNGGVAPRVPGDIPGGACGGLPYVTLMERVIMRKEPNFNNWWICHQMVQHIQQTVRHRYPNRIGMQDNSDLRVQYLLKEIDDDKWVRALRTRQKAAEKNRAIHNVLELLTVSLTDLFNTFVHGDGTNLEDSAENLRNYVNTELTKIKNNYNNKVPYITTDWECITV